MKIYCDTDSLLSNPRRHKDDPKSQQEVAAIEQLLNYHRSGKVTLFRSNVVRGEVERTRDAAQRDNLRSDFLSLVQVPLDEKPLGSDSTWTDPYGGHVTTPIVSDVQDEDLFEKLCALDLPRVDAQNFAQAISNKSDVFLTRDEKHFINRRNTLEARFPIKIRRPSELLAELRASELAPGIPA